MLTAAQRRLLVHLHRQPADTWYRAAHHGERVTLASLHTRGLADRQPWRGDGISRDSAFEYRLTAGMRDAIDKKLAAA